jgi:hypothetical protein
MVLPFYSSLPFPEVLRIRKDIQTMNDVVSNIIREKKKLIDKKEGETAFSLLANHICTLSDLSNVCPVLAGTCIITDIYPKGRASRADLCSRGP